MKKKFLFSIILMILITQNFVFAPNIFSENDENNKIYYSKSFKDLPKFESTPMELQQTYDSLAESTKENIDKLIEFINTNPNKLNFKNTIIRFENILDQLNIASNRASLLKDVHPDSLIMNKAEELVPQYVSLANSIANNGQLYKALLSYARTQPNLKSAEQKLMTDILKDFKNNGISEDGTVKPEVLSLQKDIINLETQITETVQNANSTKNYFSKEELEGLSDQQLNLLTKEEDNYLVLSGNRAVLRDVIMTYANKESTRKRAKLISNSIAPNNTELLTNICKKRLELAQILGFKSWADYAIQSNMAQNADNATTFIDNVSNLLKPKFENELKELKRFITSSNDENNEINAWDIYYFKRLYENELAVDYESLTKYFPYQKVLQGMFDVYGQVFGLRFKILDNAPVWHKDVQLVEISEYIKGHKYAPIGYIYLDNFPRLETGKFAHAASAGLIPRKDIGNSKRNPSFRKAVSAIACNFPVNSDGTPANMLYSDINTLFHEFGHSLHFLLNKTTYASQNGFNTPKDFVEVPSTLSECFLYDPKVFKMLAADSPDLTDEFINTTIKAIKKSDLATKGMMYERQFAFGKADFAMSTFTDLSQIPSADSKDNISSIANKIMADTYCRYPENSSFINSFLHIWTWGYDAGYYSYAWSDSIVSEIANIYEDPANEDGYLSKEIGMKYKKEILEPGSSKDINESVKAFTGKEIDPERTAFLKSLGL